MQIKSCYAAMGKAHLKRYEDIQNLKASSKGVIQDYSENNKASISSLHNKSSTVI